MKKTIAIIALGAALCGCQSAPEASPEQLSIQAVYSVDSRVTTNSKSPAEVVDKLQSIRLNGCPAEFVDAYRDYIKGWESLVAVTKKMYAQNMQKASSDISTFVSDYQSKPIEATVNLKKQWPAFSSDIDAATAKMVSGEWDVFTGPITDNQGNVVIAEGETVHYNANFGSEMTWLLDSIEAR